MGGATRDFFVDVLEGSLRILRDARADHLVIGGLATRAVLGRPLDVSEDIDVLIRRDDADRLLEAFASAGYATHRRDERWIYKAARPDVTVDLIFQAAERIRLDEEHLRRSWTVGLDELRLRIPAVEDLVVMKALFDAEDRQGRWYGALALLRRAAIDWDYLAERGAAQAPRRILSLLLYAADEGIDVPDRAMDRLVPIAAGRGRGDDAGRPPSAPRAATATRDR